MHFADDRKMMPVHIVYTKAHRGAGHAAGKTGPREKKIPYATAGRALPNYARTRPMLSLWSPPPPTYKLTLSPAASFKVQ